MVLIAKYQSLTQRKYELSTDKNPYTYDENEQEIVETILENETGEKFSSKVWLYINLNE